ncbi:thaumatin-like protein 1, partial [Phtheirospermum japonicum]
SSARFTFVNKCAYTVWPGILSNNGETASREKSDAPSSWGGRFWARTHCADDSTGKFTCGTGDCGSGKLDCA